MDDFGVPIRGESFPLRDEVVKEAFTAGKRLNDKGLQLCV
jgi:hypothetical protein